MLNYEITDPSEVEESLRAYYVKTDTGAYRLQISGHENAEQLRATLHTDRAARIAAEAEFADLDKARVAEFARANVDRLREFAAAKAAEIAALQAERARLALDSAATALATKLSVAGSAEVLVPHLRERLETSEVDGALVVRAKDGLTIDELGEVFRRDARFSRILVGQSPTERALHQKRVNETIGVTAARPTLTRTQFDRLSPSARAEHALGGAEIYDTEPRSE